MADLFNRQPIELTYIIIPNQCCHNKHLWFLVAPSFQQYAYSGMCWQSYIQGLHIHTVNRHWRCQFPFLSFLQPPTCLVGTYLSTWGLWRVERCVLMPNADFLTTFKQHGDGVPRWKAEPKKNGVRMWSKDKMGQSPITVHLQNKSYQFEQWWQIKYAFLLLSRSIVVHYLLFLDSVFSIRVVQFCIPYIPFILPSTSGLVGSKGACFLHSYSSLESQIGWRFGRFHGI